jgi:hypothetical protein
MRDDNLDRYRLMRSMIFGIPISLTLYAAVIWVIWNIWVIFHR